MAEPNAAAAIYDLGYQRYTGARLGRWYAMRSLWWFSVRTAFGYGRGDKAKTFPVLVCALVFLPALGQIIMAQVSGMVGLIQYAAFLQYVAILLGLFAAGQAPELIVTDKQQGVLSLYLSRPLLASDYALAKVGALVSAMMVITVGPLLLLFLAKVGLAADVTKAFGDEWTKLFPIIGGCLGISLFVASISLYLSSFAARRGYGSAAVLVFFLLTPPVIEMFRSVTSGDVKRYTLLVHPVYLIMGFANWLFDIEAKRHTAVGRADLPGYAYLWTILGVSALCITLLIRRFKRLAA